jgi:hypothetical protein
MTDSRDPDDLQAPPDSSALIDSDDQAPKILKLSRRGFLGRTAAAAAGGTLAGRAANAKKTTTKRETTLERFRLFIEARAFKYPADELYPVLTGADPRLVATSTDDWLGIWALDTPDRPRFKGKKRGADTVTIVSSARPFRRLPDTVSAVSEDSNVQAWLEAEPMRVQVIWKDERALSVPLPDDRGQVQALGLGPDGAGLAVALEVGGILLFDLRGGSPELVSEFQDADIAVNHVLQVGEDAGRWDFAPCVCDIVSAQTETKEGATVSQYNRETGAVTTTTLPCGSPVPGGAICVCNCVAAPVYDAVRTICTCNLVCTCDTVSTGTTYTYTYWYPN